MKILVFALVLMTTSLGAMEPGEEGSLRVPKALENSQIEDKAGAKVPGDIHLKNHLGQEKLLQDYFSGENKMPATILTIGYYGCPMLCSLVLNGLVEGLKNVNYQLGKDYQIISVSIDDKESYELAEQKRQTYLKALDVPAEKEKNWSFHVMSSADAKRLSDTVGFNYYFDERNNQYAHGAGFFVLSKDLVLSRTLFGIQFAPQDIKLALSEAAEGKIGSFVDQVLLSCFHYDPDSHKYGVYIFGVMRLGGILTIIILGLVLLFYFRNERRRMSNLG